MGTSNRAPRFEPVDRRGGRPRRSAAAILARAGITAAVALSGWPAGTPATGANGTGPVTLTVTSTADSGAGSLRDVLTTANATADPAQAVTIAFSLSGCPSSCTIAPSSPLPTITRPVTIDGTSQPGFSGSPIVVLNGAAAGAAAYGLTFNGSGAGSTVRGLVINGWGGGGILLSGGSAPTTIAGNYIGTDASGTAAVPNGSGVVITGSSNNVIGGAAAADRNLISGNGTGVAILSGAGGNVVKGNYIGTSANGTAGLGNGTGVSIIDGTSNTVGGPGGSDGNVIAASDFSNVLVKGNTGAGATGNGIRNNRIGTSASGTQALRAPSVPGAGVKVDGVNAPAAGTTIAGNLIAGNGTQGVLIQGGGATGTVVEGNTIGHDTDASLGNLCGGVLITGGASNNRVGGSGAGQGNTIAHNSGACPNSGANAPVVAGVAVASGTGNSIRGNRVFANAGLGIDLGADGATANDDGANDADAGANTLQNYPELSRVVTDRATHPALLVTGALFSPNGVYQIDLYKNAACGSGGQGATYLGEITLSAGFSNLPLSATAAVNPGDLINATATDAAGNTSEFSGCVAAISVPAAPGSVAAAATGGGRAMVAWTPPPDDGGSAITGYTVRAYSGGSATGASVSAGAGATSANVTGLTNGQSYTFTVAAINAAGESAESAPSNAVTPLAAVASMSLNPTPALTAVGGVVAVDIVLDTGGTPVTGAEAVLTYDPSLLEVVDGSGNPATSITLGGCGFNRPAPLANSVEVIEGTGLIDLARGTQAGTTVQGSCVLGTVRFKGKAATSGTPVAFVLPPGTGTPTSGVSAANGAVSTSFMDGSVQVSSRILVFNAQQTGRVGHFFPFAHSTTVELQQGGAPQPAAAPLVVTLSVRDAGPDLNPNGAVVRCADSSGADQDEDPGRPGVQRSMAAGQTQVSFGLCSIDLPGRYRLQAVADAADVAGAISAALEIVWTGDANGDRAVRIDDFSLQLRDFNTSGDGLPGDFDGSGTVDIMDFSRLAGTFGTRAPSITVQAGAGSTVQVSGSNWRAGRSIQLTFDGAADPGQAPITVALNGTFTGSIAIPPGASAGKHAVKASVLGAPAVAAGAWFVVGGAE